MNAPKEVASFFDGLAETWSARYGQDASFGQRLELILNAAAPVIRHDCLLLDFGCGAGDLSSCLRGCGCHVIGADIAPAMLEVARRRATHEGRAGSLVQLDPSRPLLPFADASFDGCIASSVLEYVPDPLDSLREITRVLKPGGRLIATVPDPHHPRRRVESIIRLLLNVPGSAIIAERSRWREGLQYLRISRNRQSLDRWEALLHSTGLRSLSGSTASPNCPLAVLCAEKAW